MTDNNTTAQENTTNTGEWPPITSTATRAYLEHADEHQKTITAKIIGYFIDHGAHGERIDLRDIYRSMGDDERTSTDMALAMLEETHVIDTHDE